MYSRYLTGRLVAAFTTFLLVFGLFGIFQVQAEEVGGAEPQTVVERFQGVVNSVDPIFAKCVVTPIARVLFFDIAFWDNIPDNQGFLGWKACYGHFWPDSVQKPLPPPVSGKDKPSNSVYCNLVSHWWHYFHLPFWIH